MTVGAPRTLQPSPSILFCFQLLLRRRKTSILSIQRCCSPNASFVGPFFSLTHCLNSANVETRFCDNECNVLLKKTMADILTVINTAAKLVAAVLNGICWKRAVMILFLILSSPSSFQTWLSLDIFVGMYLSCPPCKYCFPKVVKRSLKIWKEKRLISCQNIFFSQATNYTNHLADNSDEKRLFYSSENACTRRKVSVQRTDLPAHSFSLNWILNTHCEGRDLIVNIYSGTE